MTLFIGLDASTNACKAVIVDSSGAVVAEGRAAYGLDNPGPDAWEQRAESWFEAALSALRNATSALDPADRGRVTSLAIANQRETFVAADAAGKSVAPAIVWMDARCRPEVKAAAAELDPARVHAISGKPACVTPSLYKIRALFERLRPGVRASTKKLLDVHAYLVLHLTGEHVTSTAAADPLGLVDMGAATWSPELCALARAEVSMLPLLVPPATPIAKLKPAIAQAVGLSTEVTLVAGAGDGQAAGLGAGVIDERSAYLNLGTAVVSGKPSAAYRTSRAYRTLFAAIPGAYLLETDLKGGTFSLDWLADRVLGGGVISAGRARDELLADLEERATKVPPGAEGLLFLPYLAGVMNPHWDDDATGALVGLRGDHGPEHFYRAILEGLALEQRLHTERVEADAGAIDSLVAVGGGARRGLFAQIVADVMGRRLTRPVADETTALGAAILAATGSGAYDSVLEAARSMTRTGGAVDPGPNRAGYDRLYREAYSHLYESIAPVLGRLATLRA